MDFLNKFKKCTQRGSFLCVGLDTDLDKIPPHLLKEKNPVFIFNKEIVEATSDLVCAYKINSAFYEAKGNAGIVSLKETIEFLERNYPEIPIILDAKRGDIGNTNCGYLEMAFEFLGVDAITLHPYLGKTSLMPFLERKAKFLFILCRTSNEGAGEFQDLLVEGGQKLYQKVAYNVSNEWNFNGNCGLVVGATYPDELKKVREISKEILILIPGVGTQGGDIELTVKSARKNFLINASRSIIYAGKEKDFAVRAREEAVKLKEEINKWL